MPKRSAQKVSSSGIRTVPFSAKALKMRGLRFLRNSKNGGRCGRGAAFRWSGLRLQPSGAAAGHREDEQSVDKPTGRSVYETLLSSLRLEL
jgi:hypothetical protein